MEDWIVTNEGALVFGTLIGSFCVAALWEVIYPRRAVEPLQTRRWLGNLGLGFINQFLVYLFDVGASIAIGWWIAQSGAGLLSRMELGFAASLVVTVLALELTAYVIHRLMHRIPWLWRFHRVHHCDPAVDFTTTARNHPLELLATVMMATPAIAVLGPSLMILIIYQVTRTCVVILAHSNIFLPRWLDGALRYLVITPDYHRLHHSSDRHFTDSNYGVFLPIYDYLFGTATRKPFSEQKTMQVGLNYGRGPTDSGLRKLLLMPFVGADGTENPAPENG